MDKPFGYGCIVDLNNDDLETTIPNAVSHVVHTVLLAANREPGMRIRYDTLKVEAEYFVPASRLGICATVKTTPCGYTQEEMNDIQVDMIRALRGG